MPKISPPEAMLAYVAVTRANRPTGPGWPGSTSTWTLPVTALAALLSRADREWLLSASGSTARCGPCNAGRTG